jgi:malate dehydrogenase (oxaloacetate-decarboxylating)(NADP+)
MANPDPEIMYEDATSVRDDIIMATGRSDYPNQVNNVLGFPFIFRGALDVRASAINEDMKMAAVRALAELAREKVPEMVLKAYGGEEFEFGKNYIIPKPFDPRVLWHVAPAVAKAAIDSGVARINITNWDNYKDELKERLGLSKEVVRVMVQKAKKNPKRVVYPEGEEETIIRAAQSVINEGIGQPILLGDKDVIKKTIEELGYDLADFLIVEPEKSQLMEKYADDFYHSRQRKGMTKREAKQLMAKRVYFGSMMVKLGDADAMISGLTTHYPNTIKPALQCVGIRDGFNVVSGLYIVVAKKDVYFFADCTVNINPTAEQLAEIAISAADTVKEFDIEPRVAMLSFSNFGSSVFPQTIKVKKAVEIAKAQRPDIMLDGEMQADTAVVHQIIEQDFPFSVLKSKANILIFPDLDSGNIAYKLMARIGEATVIGPILMGMKKPIHVLQRGASVEDIINVTAIAVVDAHIKK